MGEPEFPLCDNPGDVGTAATWWRLGKALAEAVERLYRAAEEAVLTACAS